MGKRRTWQQIGDEVRRRRLSLGLTQQEAATRAGVSLSTWNLIETGGQESYRGLTLTAAARALGWRLDAFDRLAEGVPPEDLAQVQAIAEVAEARAEALPAAASGELPLPDAQLETMDDLSFRRDVRRRLGSLEEAVRELATEVRRHLPRE